MFLADLVYHGLVIVTCWLIFVYISRLRQPLGLTLAGLGLFTGLSFMIGRLGLLLIPFYCCFLYLCFHKRVTFLHLLFYSLFPFATFHLFFHLLDVYLIFPLLKAGYALPLVGNVFLPQVLSASLFFIFYGITHLLGLDFRRIEQLPYPYQSKPFRVIVAILVSYYVFVLVLFLDNRLPFVQNHLYLILTIYFVAYLWFLAQLNTASQLAMEEQIKQQKNDEILALEAYNEQLEQVYQQIQHFKDQQDKKLKAFSSAIANQDLPLIRQLYQTMIRENAQSQPQDSLAQLRRLQVRPIKSILSTKLIEAQQQGVSIHIEVPDKIEQIYMESVDLVLVLAIFLDNAIEAARLSKRPHINIAFFLRDATQMLIIENSFQGQVDLNQIFKQGYSTKGNDRGLGLATVQQVLADYPHVSLSTKRTAHSFIQVLEMRPQA